MAYIKNIRFDRVGKNEGCQCDNCGQYIRNIWTVEYKDGNKLHFGIDCFEKMSAAKLNAYEMKQLKKASKSLQTWTDVLEQWKSGQITEDCNEWQCEQADWSDSYWKGRSFEEYKEWKIAVWIPERIKDAKARTQYYFHKVR